MDTEVKNALDSLQGETKTILTDLVTKHGTLTEQNAAMQRQLDAIDLRSKGRIGVDFDTTESTVEILKKSESVSRLLRDRKGAGVLSLSGDDARRFMERKTVITSGAVGQATSGVLQIDRISGITTEARQQLFVRDLLTARPTNMQVVDFVKVTSPMTRASPQVEATDKFENAVTFQSKSEKVRLIATWIPASRQILDDFAELAGFLDSSLRYYVDLAEEVELLSGDATGEHLDGLIPQASAFNGALLSASVGWTKIDIVGRAVQQIMIAKELKPTFIVLHPTDWWGMRLTKDSFGRYILGDPQTAANPQNLFDLTPVISTSIASGTFLVGSGNPVAAEIRDRMELQVEISTEHASYFTQNLVAVRAEKRLALIVKRPGSYVTGTFTTSP